MYSIRKYKSSDREQLRYICKETVFDGKKDNQNRLESIALIYNDYYTDYEPENIFVAVNDDDIPVGYIICSVNTKMYFEKMVKEYFSKVAKTYSKSIPIFLANLFSVIIAKKQYRIHMHIDLLPEAQHKGLGSELIKTLAKKLYYQGVNNLTVCGINLKADSYKFYRHIGFHKIQDIAPYIATLTYNTKGAVK